jgi:hypothetical protein
MKTETGIEYELPPMKADRCQDCFYLLTELDALPCRECEGPTFKLFVRRTTEGDAE